MNMTMLFCVLVLCLTSWSVDATRSDYAGYIQPYARTNWGSWASQPSWCSEGYYAYGFRLRVERGLGSGDDTALNAIKLLCRTYCGASSNSITSKMGPWGTWRNTKVCPTHYFLKGVWVRSEPHIRGDNTAVNNYEFRCEKTREPAYTYHLQGGGMYYGSWSSRVDCPSGSYICGIKTQVESYQGSGDDTALNNARFYCCSMSKTTCWHHGFPGR